MARLASLPMLVCFLYLAYRSCCGIWALIRRLGRPHGDYTRYLRIPGPPRDLFIGHLRKIPDKNPELYYQRLSKEYDSDILYFKIFRTRIIVLNTVKAAEELLSKRGANYCDRPRFVLFEVMGWGLTLTFMPFGDRWKAHRALLQKAFTRSNIVKYRDIQEQEARQSVSSIAQTPALWENHLKRFAAAIVLRIGFGVTLTGDDDPYLKIAADAIAATAGGGSPGSSLVDYFPFLATFPGWLVPSKSLQYARNWRFAIQRLHDVPFTDTLVQFKAGTAQPSSYVYPLLKKHAENEKLGLPNDFTMADINGSAAAIFIAGSDTTYATTLIAILGLLVHPEVFEKAREVIDRVIGTGRLPSLKDRENPELRYIEYIVEETIRWRPLSPIGVPHKSLEADVYNSRYIPRGACIYYNTYAMSRDETIYHDPEWFNPDRFIPVEQGGSGEPFLQGPFGFGRRACIGKHLALASVWIVLATLIATMDISLPIGPDGEEKEMEMTFSTGLSSHPSHFDCDLKPRSNKVGILLSSTMKQKS